MFTVFEKVTLHLNSMNIATIYKLNYMYIYNDKRKLADLL